jgi:carbamoyl-phosphate synthase large subunit
MQGCGNDYVYFDGFEVSVPDPEKTAVALSDRHFGIGGDGIIIIEKSGVADGRMRMYNADGSEGSMCGNGIRCVGRFLYERRGVKKDVLTVETKSGIKTLRLDVDNGRVKLVYVDMGKAEFLPSKIPVRLDGDAVVNRPVDIGGTTVNVTCVSMGNPHCVLFGGDPDKLDLPAIGPVFENNALFPDRVNTEFVEVIDSNTLRMRVWERGSGETLACGTGACAAVAAAVANGLCQKGAPITVRLRGGELIITVTDDTVIMAGPAEFVFEGTVELPVK